MNEVRALCVEIATASAPSASAEAGTPGWKPKCPAQAWSQISGMPRACASSAMRPTCETTPSHDGSTSRMRARPARPRARPRSPPRGGRARRRGPRRRPERPTRAASPRARARPRPTCASSATRSPARPRRRPRGRAPGWGGSSRCPRSGRGRRRTRSRRAPRRVRGCACRRAGRRRRRASARRWRAAGRRRSARGCACGRASRTRSAPRAGTQPRRRRTESRGRPRRQTLGHPAAAARQRSAVYRATPREPVLTRRCRGKGATMIDPSINASRSRPAPAPRWPTRQRDCPRWSTVRCCRPSSTACGCGRRRTPERATRSRPPAAGCRWSRSMPRIPLIGAHGPVTLLDVVRGPPAADRLLPHVASRQAGAEQCEGCTFFNSQVRELPTCTRATSPTPRSARARTRRASATATSWAGTCPGTRSLDSAEALLAGRRFGRFTSSATCAMATGSSRPTGRPAAASRRWSPTHGLLDLTVYGRQERWEDSPAGWPQPQEVNPRTGAPTGVRRRRCRASRPGTPTT